MVGTMGSRIIPASILTVDIVIIILASACLFLFFDNRIGIPLSTSEVTVGAVAGAGLALGNVYWLSLLKIVFCWLLVPITAFSFAWLTGRVIPGDSVPVGLSFAEGTDRGGWLSSWLEQGFRRHLLPG